jgi:hypothetical protein
MNSLKHLLLLVVESHDILNTPLRFNFSIYFDFRRLLDSLGGHNAIIIASQSLTFVTLHLCKISSTEDFRKIRSSPTTEKIALQNLHL